MNSLSWLLYFADILSNVKAVLVTLALVSALVFGIYTMYSLIEKDEIPKFRFTLIPILLLLSASVIPQSNTIYAIAASELGEEVINSTIGRKAKTAIEQWIDSQVKEK